MKKYSVVLIYDVRSAVQVEANSEEEAVSIAYNNFRPYCSEATWETYEETDKSYVYDVEE